MDKKRVFQIGLASILVVLLGGAWYWYSYRSAALVTDSVPGDLPRGSTDTSGSSGSVRGPGTETGGDDSLQESVEPFLFQIHDKPIVSAVAFLRKATPLVRFMEQGSGNVFEYDFASKQKVRISNTSIPQIGRALWSADGTVVAFQYEQDASVRTAVGVLASTTASTEEGADRQFEKIFFLPEGIRSIALSPNGAQVAYVSKTADSGIVVIANADGSSPKIVFTSPLFQWNVSWPTAEHILISSPLAEDGGIVYRVDAKTGAKTTLFSTTKLFGGVAGDGTGKVIAAHPDTRLVSLYDTRSGTFSSLFETTWTDKCSLVAGATSTMVCGVVPSVALGSHLAWERGQFASNDALVFTNFSEGYKLLPIPTEEYGDKRFDMVNVAATPGGYFALFKNRVDGFLWGVRVPQGI